MRMNEMNNQQFVEYMARAMEHAHAVLKTQKGFRSSAAQVIVYLERDYQWRVLEAHILQDRPVSMILALAETTHMDVPRRFGLIAGPHSNHIQIDESTYHKLATALLQSVIPA